MEDLPDDIFHQLWAQFRNDIFQLARLEMVSRQHRRLVWKHLESWEDDHIIPLWRASCLRQGTGPASFLVAHPQVLSTLKRIQVTKYPWQAFEFIQPKFFEDARALTSLHLDAGWSTRSFLTAIASVSNSPLRSLRLEGNSPILWSDFDVALLANLSGLRVLNIDAHVSPEFVQSIATHLTNLSALHICCNDWTPVNSLTSLTTLCIFNPSEEMLPKIPWRDFIRDLAALREVISKTQALAPPNVGLHIAFTGQMDTSTTLLEAVSASNNYSLVEYLFKVENFDPIFPHSDEFKLNLTHHFLARSVVHSFDILVEYLKTGLTSSHRRSAAAMLDHCPVEILLPTAGRIPLLECIESSLWSFQDGPAEYIRKAFSTIVKRALAKFGAAALLGPNARQELAQRIYDSPYPQKYLAVIKVYPEVFASVWDSDSKFPRCTTRTFAFTNMELDTLVRNAKDAQELGDELNPMLLVHLTDPKLIARLFNELIIPRHRWREFVHDFFHLKIRLLWAWNQRHYDPIVWFFTPHPDEVVGDQIAQYAREAVFQHFDSHRWILWFNSHPKAYLLHCPTMLALARMNRKGFSAFYPAVRPVVVEHYGADEKTWPETWFSSIHPDDEDQMEEVD